MARIDCTRTSVPSFRELIALLEEKGFEPDHFHMIVPCSLGEDGEAFDPNGEGVRIIIEDDKVLYVQEYVHHLNLIFDEKDQITEGRWNFGDWESNPLDQDPRNSYRLVCDEWHE